MQRALFVLLITLLTAACQAKQGDSQPRLSQNRPPPLLLISLDGFRHDYRDKAETPNLDRLAQQGAVAESLIPVFPSKTFTNHWSIVTGLYAGSHGVVANSMWDPARRKRFSMRDRDAVADPAWYDGEPIWRTAERQGLTAATVFWVGSEAPVGGSHPRYWLPYDGSMRHRARIDQVLDWLDLPAAERPDLLTLYFSSVDSAGHRDGPDSERVRRAISGIDRDLGRLLAGLEKRELLGAMHIIVVSDHGMSAISRERTIVLDEYLPLDRVRVSDWGPAAQIWAERMSVDEIVQALGKAHPRLRVWRKADIPERYGFQAHRRVPDVLAEADLGWTIESRSFLNNPKNRLAEGMHGWDPAHADMHGIFIAHGPAFTPGSRLPAFVNVEIYNLLANLLGIESADNDGDPDFWPALLGARLDTP
jgi:predicted AlkP superfamily pyrophosphatase or phosphodiesterase